MWVAACRLILDFYGNTILSKKREGIKELAQGLLKRFGISLEEVEDFDHFERCVLGFSFVASDGSTARTKMKKILNYIEAHSFARVVMDDVEVEKFQ